ncbi:DUF2812 domain-containing protein [Massilia antarctica]|uniref:DUF2812 domain-containing protein n=1 Tax=Massilia antarctica TaxID=2765360 RepID=A0AA48WG80_9BURK|nr:DUF2812 domain-containing protein [Massilia antarctica]QPI50992.1 DUF2812 domain-containing protein [Massilia antarctica]
MGAQVRLFKWFRAAREQEQELWLRRMAQQGLHLASVNVLSFWKFNKGAPADVVYRLDCGDNVDEPEQYWEAFTQAGWERAADAGGWKYFRQAAVNGKVTAFPPDRYSKRDKLKAMLLQLAVVGACLGLSAWFMVDWHALRTLPGDDLLLALAFGAVAALLYGYGAYRPVMRIRQLR